MLPDHHTLAKAGQGAIGHPAQTQRRGVPAQSIIRRDRTGDRAHLLALLDRHGSTHPQPNATHFSGPIGRSELKWESHTEFVTYTAFTPGLSARPFDPTDAASFPQDWRDKAPGRVAASVLIRVEELPVSEEAMMTKLETWFVAESLAVARVVDGSAVVAGDFRIDPDGNMRFAVFVRPDTGARRVGRIVQRLCEIETYRAMSMLGLIKARELTTTLNALDPRLSALVTGLDAQDRPAEDALHDLLAIASELESLAMPGATVQFRLSPANPAPSGADLIELGLISRPDSPWIPMSKGASGGELSRIMLAVEVVLAAADPTETFVFDEVDAGVGGAAAVEVGKRLARLARNAQVIVVTHLPQVAAFADRHLVIARSDGQEVHSSSVSEVQQGERVAELSRMLAGLADSQAGTQLAEELLALAQVERKAK